LTEAEQLSWYISIGEQRGGQWSYHRGRWLKTPQPQPVFAIPAKMKSQE